MNTHDNTTPLRDNTPMQRFCNKIIRKRNVNTKHLRRFFHKKEYEIVKNSMGLSLPIKEYYNSSHMININRTKLGEKMLLTLKFIPSQRDLAPKEINKKEYDNMHFTENISERSLFLIFDTNNIKNYYSDEEHYYVAMYNSSYGYDIVSFPKYLTVRVDMVHTSNILTNDHGAYYREIKTIFDNIITKRLIDITRDCIGGNNNVVDTKHLDDIDTTVIIIKPYINLMTNLHRRFKNELFQTIKCDLTDKVLCVGNSLGFFENPLQFCSKYSIQLTHNTKWLPKFHSNVDECIRIGQEVYSTQSFVPYAFSEETSNLLMRGASSIIPEGYCFHRNDNRKSRLESPWKLVKKVV